MEHEVPDDHPRAASLRERYAIAAGLDSRVVTRTGLVAHGRGEAFDYLIGETTIPLAQHAIRVAAAKMLLAKHPIISVNGNAAALVPQALVDLSAATGAHLEINLFYREEGRVPAIQALLESRGAHLILGTGDVSPVQIQELSSNRRIVDPRGIAKADVVLVPLEDGDRTEALVREGKYVIAIDLNPLSRTAQYADLTIVDNITRCLPALVTASTDLRSLAATDAGREQLAALCASFDQAENLSKTLEHIITRLQGLAAAGRSLGPRGDMTHD